MRIGPVVVFAIYCDVVSRLIRILSPVSLLRVVDLVHCRVIIISCVNIIWLTVISLLPVSNVIVIFSNHIIFRGSILSCTTIITSIIVIIIIAMAVTSSQLCTVSKIGRHPNMADYDMKLSVDLSAAII